MDTAKPVNFDEAVVSPQPVGGILVTETHLVTYVTGSHGMDHFLSIEKQVTWPFFWGLELNCETWPVGFWNGPLKWWLENMNSFLWKGMAFWHLSLAQGICWGVVHKHDIPVSFLPNMTFTFWGWLVLVQRQVHGGMTLRLGGNLVPIWNYRFGTVFFFVRAFYSNDPSSVVYNFIPCWLLTS